MITSWSSYHWKIVLLFFPWLYLISIIDQSTKRTLFASNGFILITWFWMTFVIILVHPFVAKFRYTALKLILFSGHFYSSLQSIYHRVTVLVTSYLTVLYYTICLLELRIFSNLLIR